MYTDWLLIRRLAAEIDERFGGARVRDAGRLANGVFALELWQRGKTQLLAVDIFSPTPCIYALDGDLPIAAEPGFVRAAGAALRGTTLRSARSRPGDRLIRFDFAARSRFGIEDAYALVAELVPRFGNVVLLKRDGDSETVVAAAKEFDASRNAVRSIRAGGSYRLPPLRTRNATPLLDDETAAALASRTTKDDLYVYRRGADLVQAHLAPLAGYADLEESRSPSLIDLFAEERSGAASQGGSAAGAKRRSLEATLDRRERKARVELDRVDTALAQAGARETLRDEGNAIYATLHERPSEERGALKERAADLFAQYKKAAARAAHLTKRRTDLQTALADLATLRWELERADDDELDDVSNAIDPAPARKRTSRPAKRKPLEFRAPGGSRIVVGRTPGENAEITFRMARPDDLWFHVRGQPGAHVILQRDDRKAPPRDDILAAAALAALHSKARDNPKVTVDYTARKHVRKRPAAAPGLVFYTHPSSVLVAPGSPPRDG